MNLLFFTLSFLCLFLFLDSALWKEAVTHHMTEQGLARYIDAKYALYNQLESDRYTQYKKQLTKTLLAKTKTSIHNKEATPTTFVSPRTKATEQTKWNLAPWLTHANEDLSNALYQFLYMLYGHTSFWNDDAIQKLITAWKQPLQDSRAIHQLSDLFPEDPSLHLLFYRLFKGSSIYDLIKKRGYPPLSDFFCILSTQATTLCFTHAHPLALQALLGERLATEIIAQEQKQHASLSQQDLLNLQAVRTAPHLTPFISAYLSFTTWPSSTSILIEQEGIRLQVTK